MLWIAHPQSCSWRTLVSTWYCDPYSQNIRTPICNNLSAEYKQRIMLNKPQITYQINGVWVRELGLLVILSLQQNIYY